MIPETRTQTQTWRRRSREDPDVLLAAIVSSGQVRGGADKLEILAQKMFAARVSSCRGLSVAGLVSGVIASALLGRQGTVEARGAGAALLVAVAFLSFGFYAWTSRCSFRPLLRAVARTDPAAAARFTRALSLLRDVALESEAHGSNSMSPELAKTHFERQLSSLPLALVERRAHVATARLSAIALVWLMFAMVAAGFLHSAIVEGVGVLLATDRVSPLTKIWLGNERVTVRPPEYLHLPEEDILLSGENGTPSALPLTVIIPEGSILLFEGTPLSGARPMPLSGARLMPLGGARLELFGSDGSLELHDDGHGDRVVSWQSFSSEVLTIGARFGEVVIPEPFGLTVHSLHDDVPVVTLDGAPLDLRPDDVAVREGILLAFQVADDHGLSEIELVLRSGAREERRKLAHLDGTARTYDGAEVVRLRDPFIRASVEPVELSIEARDNDGATGPKWGKSAPISYIPAEIGKGEARRADALRGLRATLVDSLAWRLAQGALSDRTRLRADADAFLSADSQRQAEDEAAMTAVLETRYDGLTVPRRAQMILRRLARASAEAVEAETRSPNDLTRDNVVLANERWVYAVDRLIGVSGNADTKKVVTRLADIADELSQSTDDVASGHERALAITRMTRSETILGSGGRSMRRLGSLGRDLGEIVLAYLERIETARGEDDLVGAHLAAMDLALRLHTPDPSFGSKGGKGRKGGRSGGDSSGDSNGEPDDDGESEPGRGGGDGNGEGAGDPLAGEIERLSAEHDGQMSDLDEKVRAAKEKQNKEASRDELRRHAALVRDGVKELPSLSDGSDSWSSKGASARESAEQMAHALEGDALDEAIAAGRQALGALDEAKEIAGLRRYGSPGARKRIDDAKQVLQREVAWAEQSAKMEAEKTAEAVKAAMKDESEAEQKTARRAEQLAAGKAGDPPSDSVAEALNEARRSADQASRQLSGFELEKGRESQKDVQRALERARQQLDEEKAEAGEASSHKPDGSKGTAQSGVTVPGADAHQGPGAFRQRVLDGLRQGGEGPLKDAVRKYADGLLR